MAAHILGETASVPCKRVRRSSDASPTAVSFGESYNQSLSDTPSFPIPSATLPPMKRRVNPDSLASRLAPELVREMDAFIMSGNMEMPSFAVRKELQERYNIDRRHIYDYFHSKGMRVVKDDKVSNLVRRTDRPIKTPQTSVRHVRPRKSFVDDFEHDSISLVKPNNNVPVDKKPTRKRPQISLKNRSLVAIYSPKGHPLISSSTAGLRNDHLEVDVMDINEPDPPMPSLSYEFSSYPASAGPDSFLDVLDPLLDFNGVPISAAEVSNDCSSNMPDCCTTPPTDRPMSQEERMAMYNSLDALLGPACGIQESVGTYRKYMQEKSQLYFDRLSRNSARAIGTPSGSTSFKLGASATESEDRVDFRRWLLCGRLPMGSRYVTAITSRIGTGTEYRFSASHVTQEPTIFLSAGCDKPIQEIMDDSLPETTPIDTLGYLLDSDDPVVRSTVATSDLEGDFSASRYELKVTFDVPTLGTPAVASNEGANRNNPVILSPAKVLDRNSWSRRPSQRRDRSGRMQSSAAVHPIGPEFVTAKEQVQMSPMFSSKTAALRSVRTGRKRSCPVSARLRTTSAGGGI